MFFLLSLTLLLLLVLEVRIKEVVRKIAIDLHTAPAPYGVRFTKSVPVSTEHFQAWIRQEALENKCCMFAVPMIQRKARLKWKRLNQLQMVLFLQISSPLHWRMQGEASSRKFWNYVMLFHESYTHSNDKLPSKAQHEYLYIHSANPGLLLSTSKLFAKFRPIWILDGIRDACHVHHLEWWSFETLMNHSYDWSIICLKCGC